MNGNWRNVDSKNLAQYIYPLAKKDNFQFRNSHLFSTNVISYPQGWEYEAFYIGY